MSFHWIVNLRLEQRLQPSERNPVHISFFFQKGSSTSTCIHFWDRFVTDKAEVPCLISYWNIEHLETWFWVVLLISTCLVCETKNERQVQIFNQWNVVLKVLLSLLKDGFQEAEAPNVFVLPLEALYKRILNFHSQVVLFTKYWTS